MGKPYASELSRLEDTYCWALRASIEPLVTAVSRSATLPLIAVGSGGSFSCAHLACALHQHYTGMVSRPFTPLDLVSSAIHLRSTSTLFLSAGGSNADIIAACQDVIQREAQHCTVICLKSGSPLIRLADSYPFVTALSFDSPVSKDGFLATNSLLAFSTLLVRAYSLAFLGRVDLPTNFAELLSRDGVSNPFLVGPDTSLPRIWERSTLVVLYGPSVASAAIDFESKFSEAALGNVQLSDFRNFAHGRHHWLARRADMTGVLALYSESESRMAERTLGLVPTPIPVTRVCLPGKGPVASLAGIVTVMHLVGAAGQHLGIDPGKPGVPLFGRRLYGLRTLHTVSRRRPSIEDMAIARKLRCDVKALDSQREITSWRRAYHRFLDRLGKARFGAALFDYDGTLCEERDRFTGLREEAAEYLSRIAHANIIIGIATGRGKSVRDDLRRAIPKAYWYRFFIGYYNGADIASLDTENHPDPTLEPFGQVRAVSEAISAHPILPAIAIWEMRPAQVSIHPKSQALADLIWRTAQELALATGLQAVRSGHSIDLILPTVSKRLLVHHLLSRLPQDTGILCIGDKGQPSGNDYDLLTGPYSLSVEDVSADPENCWNLSPAGLRGVQATLTYLDALQLSEGTFTVDLDSVEGRHVRSKQ